MPRPSRKEELFALLPGAEVIAWTKAELGRRGTVEHLMDKMDVTSDTTIGRYLHMLHEEGRAYIGRWVTPNGWPAAVWVQGNGEHAPVPVQDDTTRKNRYRKNVKRAVKRALAGRNFDERYTRHVRRAQADETIERLRVAPNHWFSAIPGAV
jgi:hypothetical protein